MAPVRGLEQISSEVSSWLSSSLHRPWVYMGLSLKPQCLEPRTPVRMAEMSRVQMQVLKNWVESSSVKEMAWPGSLGTGNYSPILALASLIKF